MHIGAMLLPNTHTSSYFLNRVWVEEVERLRSKHFYQRKRDTVVLMKRLSSKSTVAIFKCVLVVSQVTSASSTTNTPATTTRPSTSATTSMNLQVRRKKPLLVFAVVFFFHAHPRLIVHLRVLLLGQEWRSWTTVCTRVGRCRWTGSKFTCRPTNSSP